MSKDNPFAVLGLDPSVLSGLSSVQVDTLVKGVANTLQKICHPDIISSNSKLAKRSIAINKAMEQLDRKKYPQAFVSWREEFIKKTPMKQKLFLSDKVIIEASVDLARACSINSELLASVYFPDLVENNNTLDGKLIRVHNTWLSCRGYRYVATLRKNNVFYEYKIGDSGSVVEVDGVVSEFNKTIVACIDDGVFINSLMEGIKKLDSDIAKRRRIAGVAAARNGKTKYRGPIISKENYGMIIAQANH